MQDYIAERKFIIISIIAIVGFFMFAIFQKPTESVSAGVNFKDINTSSTMYRGNKDAKVSIIQYSDFLCPSCSLFSTQVMPKIDTSYVATEKVNFEFRPMAFIADGSTQAGMGAYCAIDEDKFWPYHDAIYAYVVNAVFNEAKNPKVDTILTADIVKSIAKNASLKSDSFDTCLDSKKHLADITQSTNQANRNRVNGTPYIMVNGQQYTGDINLTPFDALIKSKL